MRNGPLWSNVVFEAKVIFHWDIWIDFETSAEVSNSNVCKHTTSCDKGAFLYIILSQLRRPILSLSFQRFVILCICWDTPTVKTVFDNYQRCAVSLKKIFRKQFRQVGLCQHSQCTLILTSLNTVLNGFNMWANSTSEAKSKR